MNTTNTTNPTVLIAYHANCIDGFTAAWVTACAMNREDKQYKLLPMEYNEESSKELFTVLGDNFRITELYIVDFSVSSGDLHALATMSDLYVMILDHHKTAFERYCPDMEVKTDSRYVKESNNLTVILDNDQSGASLCWVHFNVGTEMPWLIKYVKDYDLWRFNHGGNTKLINKFLRSAHTTISEWSCMARDMEDSRYLATMLESGRQLQKLHNENVRQIVAEATGINICGESGLAVACPYEFVSDVGHTLADQCGTFGAMYQVDVTANKVKWSLRSNGDFDVSAIAKYYGGGGHKNAAGFETQLFSDTPSGALADLVDKAEELYGE